MADNPVIGRRPSGGLYATREPRPGESYAYTYGSLGDVRRRANGGALVIVESPADLATARARERPGAILAVEGGDFLEGRIERVEEAHARGIRSIQLVHVERMIRAIGVDHVGLGTDMDGISPPSFVAMDDYAEWPSVPAALLARGRSREDVAKVMGGNFLRVYQQVTE